MESSTSSVTPSIGALNRNLENTSRLIITTSAKINAPPTLFNPEDKSRKKRV